jgi:hypothetical protein
MPIAGLTAGQFPVYKELSRPYHPRMQRKAHVAQQLSEPWRVDEFTAPSRAIAERKAIIGNLLH